MVSRRRFVQLASLALLETASLVTAGNILPRVSSQPIEEYFAQSESSSAKQSSKIYLGVYDLRPTNGKIDAPSIVSKLESAHINFYNYLIINNPADWNLFPNFLELTQAKNMDVIVTLRPPSEPPISAPYGYDWPKWAEELTELSKSRTNLIGFTIDDFFYNFRHHDGHNKSIVGMMEKMKEMDSQLTFLPTLYEWQAPDFKKCYGNMTDGVLIYPDTFNSAAIDPNEILWKTKIAQTKKDFSKVFVGIYASPLYLGMTADKVRQKTLIAYDSNPTGIVQFRPPWSGGAIWDTITEVYSKCNK